KAASPSRSKSSRLTVMTWSTRVDVHAGEEETHFHGGGLGRIGAVHRVGVDAVGEIGTDGAGGGLLGVGGAHEVAVLEDGAFAFEHLDHHRAADHELDQIL